MLSDFIALAGGELLSKLAGFAAFAWLARVLLPKDYGAVELALALSVFFCIVIDFGFGPIGVRAIARDKSLVPVYASRILGARILATLFAVPVMMGTVFLMEQPPEANQLIWLFAVGLIGIPWNQRWLLQGLEMMGWVSIGQLVKMGAFMAGVMLWVRDADHLLRVGVLEIVACLAMGGYFILIQQWRVTPIRLDFSFAPLKRLYREAASVGMSNMVWTLNLYLPIVLIGVLAGSEATAWFGAAHRIVMALLTFGMLYHFNLFPTIARCLGESHTAFYRVAMPSFRVTAWVGIFAALTVSLLAAPISRTVYGAPFEAAALPLAILVWAFPINVLAGHARWALIAGDHQRWALLSQVLGAVAMLIAGGALIPWLGAVGGSVAAIVALLVTWVSAHQFARRRIGKIPFIGPLVRPLSLAGCGATLLAYAPASQWYLDYLVCLGFALLAPFVDRQLIVDFKRLVGAKTEHTGE